MQFDKNKDGLIDEKEMDELLSEITDDFNTRKLAKTVIKKHDINRDGGLDADEFREVMGIKLFSNRLNQLLGNFNPRKRPNTVENNIKFCPPPLGIFIISMLQIFLYFWDVHHPPKEGR